MVKTIWNNFFETTGPKRTRVGRGIGSGFGKTAGYGHKGQGQRKGPKLGFEGGQTPIYRTHPKRGGFIGCNRRYNKMKVFNDQLVERKIPGYDVNKSEFLSELRNNFHIPFYIKRVKIVGKKNEIPVQFKLPGASKLPSVNRENREHDKILYRNKKAKLN